MPLVFVYGTLRPGEYNHHYLASAEHLGGHVTAPAFTLCDTGVYPAALDGGATALVGEVFSVSDTVFAELDRLEGYPCHYTRRPIDTPYGPAWIYLWAAPQPPDWPRIEHGDWCRHRREANPSFAR